MSDHKLHVRAFVADANVVFWWAADANMILMHSSMLSSFQLQMCYSSLRNCIQEI